MARPQSRYVCQVCAASTLRWEGQCRGCGAWNTLVETVGPSARATPEQALTAIEAAAAAPPLVQVRAHAARRAQTGISEVDRVLGGGLVPGSLILLGGEPGVGKSTLILEVAAAIASRQDDDGSVESSRSVELEPRPVLYVSGEESAEQLQLRATRLGISADRVGDRLRVLAETDVDRVIAVARGIDPALMIIDSIQTLTVDSLDGPAGAVGQVREAASRLHGYAKQAQVPVALIGHVTKDGSLAGPRTLEHLVDVVLTLEGERFASLRLLRASKNRFGSTEEVGVLEMTEAGLRGVTDPARAFLGPSAADAPGVVVAATLEGSRPLLVELQALVVRANGYTMPRRTVAGIDGNRLALLIAVLARRAGIGIADHDVYASIMGGVSITEPALDLPLAIALASAARDRPIRRGLVACGEVGLLGELRPVRGLTSRLREAVRLGFEVAIVPRDMTADRSDRRSMPRGIELVDVATLSEAIEQAWTGESPRDEFEGAATDPARSVSTIERRGARARGRTEEAPRTLRP